VQHLLNYQDWINESLTEWKLVTENDNEDWGEIISTGLHLFGDIAAAVADCIVPFSGAVIDAVNAISYFVEAGFAKDENHRTMLIMSGFIQIAAVFAVGPLQAFIVDAKILIQEGFTLLKNSKLIGMFTKLPDIITALTKIKSLSNEIITEITKKIGPGSKFEKVGKWMMETLHIPDVIKWISNFLTNTAMPALTKFLEKLAKLVPPAVKKVLKATGHHEAAELLLKNVLKPLTKGTVVYNAGHQVAAMYTDQYNMTKLAMNMIYADLTSYKAKVNKFETDNHNWWVGQIPAANTYSAITPATVPTNQPKINYDFLNNPPQPFNPPFGR